MSPACSARAPRWLPGPQPAPPPALPPYRETCLDSSSVRSFGVSVDGRPCVWPCSFSGIKQCLYIQVNVGLPPSNQADNRLKKRIPSRNPPCGDAPS
ncbi:protein of unknown function [Cupriavidus neocaledonicus]|uniref:Uncharacterized protein n=1 Tax=Cupriavidus neocaledonicus TaxID=1040979 RepID=A0A375H799_9BURK|nr:protein of unknown function [Cupriavidus neocaledonicus]